jgi:hypothetical protein
VAEIERAERSLFALRDSLATVTGSVWTSHGITLDSAPSGQRCLYGFVEGGDLTFVVQLSPSNYWSEWQPGDEPRVMAHDAWNVEAEVYDAEHPDGHELLAELTPCRRDTPEEACAALADVCLRLGELALSREPTSAAWRGGQRA